jgi:hypothetical protein
MQGSSLLSRCLLLYDSEIQAWPSLTALQARAKKFDAYAEEVHIGSRDVYAFDRFTFNQVVNVPACRLGEPLKVHHFTTDSRYKDHIIRHDWIGIIGSLVKVMESYILWRAHARILCWVTSFAWFYFLICAAVLQLQKLSRGSVRDFDCGRVDLIAGKLPTTRKRGEELKILLGAPRNFRHHLLWRIIWAVGGAVCALSLVSCYVLLGREKAKIVYIWVGFQISWLILRSIFFHFALGTNTMIYPALADEGLGKLGAASKRRVLRLVFALAKYQMHTHPRGSYSYEEDLRTLNRWTISFHEHVTNFKRYLT